MLTRPIADLAGPRGLPFFGSVLAFRPTRMHQLLESWAREYGTPCRVRLIGRDMLVCADPSEISDVLRARPDTFRRGRPLQSVFRDMGITGVFSAEGETWERQRRLVMRAFDPGHLKRYFPNLVTVTERLRQRWSKAAARGEVLDIQSELMRYTVDVTAGLAFGADVNTIDGDGDVIQNHLDKVFPMVSRRLTAPFPYWRTLKLPADHALEHHLRELRAAIGDFIAAARERMRAQPERVEQPANLIEALLAARDREDSGFTDEDVSGNVFTALLAGEDTTANTLAWLCFFLCETPGAQAALAAEVDAVMGTDDRIRDLSQLAALPWLEAAAREAMRLKPVAPLLFFEALRPTQVGGVRLAAGDTVATLMRLPGIDASRFDDPLAFRPERWLAGGMAPNRATDAKKALMPFGGGPRFCPGRYLALHEINMVAAMLGRHFRLERLPGAVGERYNLSMMPTGLRIRLHARG